MTIPFITSNYISTYPTTFGSFTPFYSAAKMPSIFTQYPAASYIRYYKGDDVVIINKEHLDETGFKNCLQINEPIGKVFSSFNS